MHKFILILSVALFIVGCADGGEALRDALYDDMIHGMDWVGDASISNDAYYDLKYYQATTRPYTTYHTYGAYPTMYTRRAHYK